MYNGTGLAEANPTVRQVYGSSEGRGFCWVSWLRTDNMEVSLSLLVNLMVS